jgi:hypothetical protein
MLNAVTVENERRARIEFGKTLVESGNHYPLHHGHQTDLMRYYKTQREAVRRRGQCDAGCQCDLVRAADGDLVCPHTWRVCPGKTLVNIVSILKKVNG